MAAWNETSALSASASWMLMTLTRANNANLTQRHSVSFRTRRCHRARRAAGGAPLTNRPPNLSVEPTPPSRRRKPSSVQLTGFTPSAPSDAGQAGSRRTDRAPGDTTSTSGMGAPTSGDRSPLRSREQGVLLLLLGSGREQTRADSRHELRGDCQRTKSRAPETDATRESEEKPRARGVKCRGTMYGRMREDDLSTNIGVRTNSTER